MIKRTEGVFELVKSPIFRLIKFPKILLENEARELNNSEGWKGLQIVNYEIIRVVEYLLASENRFKLKFEHIYFVDDVNAT